MKTGHLLKKTKKIREALGRPGETHLKEAVRSPRYIYHRNTIHFSLQEEHLCFDGSYLLGICENFL